MLADQALPDTVPVTVSTVVPLPLTRVTVTTWPFSAPGAVPLMLNPALASARLRMLSPAMVLMVTVGGVSSTVRLRVTVTAGLPAASDTLAVTVSLPSASARAWAGATVAVQLPPDTVPVSVATVLPDALTMATVTTWPFSAPGAVPLTANPALASARLRVLSPAIVAMAIVGGVTSTTKLPAACVAALPAASATLAWTV